jgi:eukaryotic-like serine/threonine-protein kinase
VERTGTAPIGDGDRGDEAADVLSVALGDVIANKYRVDRILGRGGMGVVVGATHLALDEAVAIKMLRPALVFDPDAVARFLREARAASKLKSAHAARVVDVDTLPSGGPYIVMEYLEGKDLADVLAAEGPIAIADAVTWVLQSCEAVAEAHALRIVHRDLKPTNLFRCKDINGRALIKVLDFGVSRILDDATTARGIETSASVIVGTPAYMAPEQHESARKADERSDIWALGVILYELLTGKRPFLGDSPVVVYATIVTCATPSPRDARPEVPEGLAAVVMRCLSREPGSRFQSAAELAAALAPFAADVTIAERVRDIDSARRSSRRERAAGPASVPDAALAATELASSRPRRWLIVAAAAAVAAVVGFVAFARSRDGAEPASNARETTSLSGAPTAPPPLVDVAPSESPRAAATERADGPALTHAETAPPPPARRSRAAPRSATTASASPSPPGSSIDESYRHRTSF